MNIKKWHSCSSCGKKFKTLFNLLDHSNLHTGEKPYMCPACGTQFMLLKEYVTHARKYQGEHYFPCQVCEIVFNSQLELSKHNCEKYSSAVEEERPDCAHNGQNGLRNTVDKPTKNKYQCFICMKNFKKWTTLKNHRELHFSNQFECKICYKNCSNIKLLHSHVKSHLKGNKDIILSKQLQTERDNNVQKKSLSKEGFTCGKCEKWYASQEKLTKHVCFISSNGESFKCSCSVSFDKAGAFKLHIGNKPYSCCRCSMQFNILTNLIRHIRTHTKQKPYICKDCGRGFSQSANLRNHSSIHLGVKAVKCDKCDFSCKTQGGLVKHKKKHEGQNTQNYIDGRKLSNEPSYCPICKKQFLFRRNLGMHIKSHTKKEALCTECGKIFANKSRLSTHVKACHGQPSICKTCGKTFASLVLLNAHEKIHVKEKIFTCDVCEKPFSVKNYLIQHMKTHSEGKQFFCTRCGKLFKVAVSLKYHSKICSATFVENNEYKSELPELEKQL